MGVKRVYQLRCATTAEAKAEYAAVRSRLVSVMGATRTPSQRFAHSVALITKRTAGAAGASAVASKTGKKDEKTDREFFRVILSDKPSVVFLVCLPTPSPPPPPSALGSASAPASTAPASASLSGGTVLEAGPGIVDILSSTGAFAPKLTASVDGEEFVVGDFIVRLGNRFLSNKLREFVVVEIEYGGCASAEAGAASINEFFASLVSAPNFPASASSAAASTAPSGASNASGAATSTSASSAAPASASSSSSSSSGSASPLLRSSSASNAPAPSGGAGGTGVGSGTGTGAGISEPKVSVSTSVGAVAAFIALSVSNSAPNSNSTSFVMPAYRSFEVDWNGFGLSAGYTCHHSAVQYVLHLFAVP